MERTSKKYFQYDANFASIYNDVNFDDICYYFVKQFELTHAYPTGSLVDLCCGTGQIANIFKTRFEDLEVVGYDLSQNMLEFANYNNITFRNDSILSINEKFDNIVCNNAYHHFDDISLFWDTIHRISHESTNFLISDNVRPDTEAQLNNIVTGVLGNNSPLSESFELALSSSYSIEELNDHAKDYNLIVHDTPVADLKIFFIHN